MPFTPHYVSIEQCPDIRGVAVVLDVLRAFTTAAWAFELGAERIILSDDLDEALLLKSRFPGSLALQDSRPLPGFELSNSPIQLREHDLRGCTIIQKTTHGTMGAVAARHAEHLFCAGFSVANATASAIGSLAVREAYFVVTGENGAADEDRACAEYIAALVDDPRTDATPFVHRVAASSTAARLAESVREGQRGILLGDIDAAMEVDRFNFVMRAKEEAFAVERLLILRAYN
jgi:2-phosphosulfolactate phosphatase